MPRTFVASMAAGFALAALLLAFAPARCAAADPELVAHWSFDAASGVDSSGHGFTLALAGGASFGPGPRNTALTLPGPASYGTASANPAFVPSTRSWSVACWVRAAYDTSSFRSMVTWYRCGANAGCGTPDAALIWLLLDRDGHASWYLRDDHSNEAIVTSQRVIADGQWHHVAGVYDAASGTEILYVDGLEDGRETRALGGFNAGSVPVPLSIGRVFRTGWGQPGEYMVGSLDDVRIYSRALTPADVQALRAGATLGAPRAAAGTVALGPAEPNPSRARTSLTFQLPAAAQVRLTVHDVAGRTVAVLADGAFGAGPHSAAWDGRDTRGEPAPGGVYFYRLRAQEPSGAGAVVRSVRGTIVR